MGNFGVCWFDDPEICLSGWASLNGSEPRRIAGYSELSPQHYWVTNTNHFQYKKLNLYSSPHILDEQYFRSKLQILADEIGLGSDPERAVKYLSKVFNDVISWSQKSFGDELNNPFYRFSYSLADIVIPRYARQSPKGPHASSLLDIFKQATQINQGMAGVYRPKGSVSKAFSYPRSNYAYLLLSQSYPANNNWTPMSSFKDTKTIIGVQDGSQVKGTKGVIRALVDKGENKAVMLKIHLESMERSYQPFASFGAGSSWVRNWVTLPEALDLSRYAKFSILEGFETTSCKLDIISQLPPRENGVEGSFSKALFLENVWTSLSKTLSNGKVYTALGAYIRAYDRILCGRKAEMFASNGFIVGSYSTGRIILFVTKSQEKLANELAVDAGLIPPCIQGVH